MPRRRQTQGVVFKGLRQLDRALRRADRDLQKRFRARLRAIAGEIAVEAKAIAEQKGLRESGDMIRQIRPFVRQSGAGVRSASVHRGFAYPKRLEFEGRDGRMYGPRATLLPAYEDRKNSVFAAAERLLDDVADEYRRG